MDGSQPTVLQAKGRVRATKIQADLMYRRGISTIILYHISQRREQRKQGFFSGLGARRPVKGLPGALCPGKPVCYFGAANRTRRPDLKLHDKLAQHLDARHVEALIEAGVGRVAQVDRRGGIGMDLWPTIFTRWKITI